jgi:Sulfotransferase family
MTVGASLRCAVHRARRKTRGTAADWRAAIRATDDADVLVENPVFLLSSVRSGSTLLRMMLDRHPAICAPHEMHLGSLEVTMPAYTTGQGLREIGLDQERLQLMLWDRVLLRELMRSNKSIIVDKTPRNAHWWRRIATFWPQARYIILLRHPVRIAESLVAARGDLPVEKHYAAVNAYAQDLHAARSALPGLTVRYERLTTEPEASARELCDYLQLPYDDRMLRYAGDGQVLFRRGLGDWSPTIKSGRIRPAGPDPLIHEIPDELIEACRLLGYR